MNVLNAEPSKFSVGLTGGIGSGKTTVANLFADRGATVVDTDAIAHQLTVPGGIAIPTIRAEFGDSFIEPSGAMDRTKMRVQVFVDPTAKKRLEAILHPLIRQESEREAAASDGAYVIFVVPLLVESERWRERVTRVLVVDCPETQQIERVMARNGMSRAQVIAIMANQATRAERLAAADDIIPNETTAEAMIPKINQLHALYLRLANET